MFGHIIVTLIGFGLLQEGLQNWLGKGLAEGIGGSLIATGITGILLFLYIQSSDTVRQRLEVFTTAGLMNVFPHRSVRMRSEYEGRLARAKRIDLVGWGLSAFRQDFGSEFVKWSHQADVRILLIDPDFPTRRNSVADQRDREENRPPGETRDQVEEFEKLVAGLDGLDTRKFQVRRTRAVPSINVFRIDDEIFWGPYLIGQQSRNTPTLIVRRGGFLFTSLEQHFDELWRQAEQQPAMVAGPGTAP
jgi:hypothetical protein